MREACAALLDPRLLLEVAAEFDPDTYVSVLDTLDVDTDELECADAEPNCDEDEDSGASLWIFENCTCCGSNINSEKWEGL